MKRLCLLMGLFIVTAAGCSSSNPVGPTSDSGSTPGGASSTFDSELAFCVSETNRYRAMVGLRALSRSATLEAYAAEGAREDGLAHAPHQHFRRTGGGGIALAENEIPWWSGMSVRTVIQQGFAMMWGEGPGGDHYENMRGPYTQLGCGVFVNGTEITVVQNFQ